MNWISVKDSLPDYNIIVLICYYPNSPVMEGILIGVDYRRDIVKGNSLPKPIERKLFNNSGFFIGRPTHWMPLPDLPSK